jgi:uncharacterized membrane protein YfcA
VTDFKERDAAVDGYVRRVHRREIIHRVVTGLAVGAMFSTLGSMAGSAIQHHDRGTVIRSAVAIVIMAVLYYEIVWRDLRRNR